MTDSLKNNPFARLFPSLEDARKYAEYCALKCEKKPVVESVARSKNIPNQHVSINDKIERIFGITLDKESANQAVYLSDIAESGNQQWLDLAILDQALFERLLVEEPEKLLLNAKRGNWPQFVVEKNVLTYLYHCYEGIVGLLNTRAGNQKEDLERMENLILRNMATALKQPVLYSSQNLYQQLIDILLVSKSSFLNLLVEEIEKDEETSILETVFGPFFEFLFSQLSSAVLGSTFVKDLSTCLVSLANNAKIAKILMDFTTPKLKTGAAFQQTLFGALLSLSCLPKNDSFLGDYFLKNSWNDAHFERDTDVIWSTVAELNENVYQIFNALLRVSPETNRKLVAWIADCLGNNKDLGKMWRAYEPDKSQTVSLAFMINLAAVLVQLCQPIVSDRSGSKIMKIDPTYGATGIFREETCLVTNSDRPIADKFNFITEIFFLAHRAVDLGFRVANELFLQGAEDVANLNDALQDARRTGFDEVVADTERQLKHLTMVTRSYYAAILEPKARELILKLNVATSNWIIQVLLDKPTADAKTYQITENRQLKFPLPDQVPPTMACIPEFLVENLNWHLALLFRVKDKCLELNDLELMTPLVTMIIVLTKGKKRVNNPYLRAGLVACLKCFAPQEGNNSSFVHSNILEAHPHANEIIESLLDVFVSIEISEQKFKYRQPIYVLIELLWSYDSHRKRFKELSAEAEANMEAVDPPIFLRFLNLLINDAVFLLDEALSNMARLKTMELARASEEYAKKPIRERMQDDALFRQTGMIARFDNIMGKWTIKTLQLLTTEIKTIFSHPTMADRVASMLNYFLNHFVGPNKKNLTVKDKDEYNFKPGQIVLIISQIYANLSGGDDFCLAISRDGRSYNPRLFIDAEHVLCRVGGSFLVPEIREVAARVAEMASKLKRHDELVVDAPDEFFDPIMSTIMTDPVVLPTSHVTVDRATIARHLLSDQTDPFNRQPLSMDMVQPDDALREKIQKWIEERSKE